MTQEVMRYCLSKNDLDIIKGYTDKPLGENARKTLTILSEVFGGLHHLDSNQLELFDFQSDYYNEYLIGGSIATFDDMNLTCLVIMAHDMMVRLQIDSMTLTEDNSDRYSKFIDKLVQDCDHEYNVTREMIIEYSRSYLRLMFHQREREGDFSRRHPTLEDSMEGFRKGNKRYV